MKNLNIMLATALVFATFGTAMAQSGPPATPIDGGLSVLLAAAGIYGVKKIKAARKQ